MYMYIAHLHCNLDQTLQLFCLTLIFILIIRMFITVCVGADSANPQLLLFSATVPFWVREVADKYMSHDKVVVDLIGRQSLKTAVTVEHKAICCPYAERPSTIADVIQVHVQ